MSELRKKYSAVENIKLFNQTGGICPICLKPLIYEKNGKLHKLYEIAHIYPLSPTEKEEEILKNEKILFLVDKNELDNVIALCPNCHTKFDKPTTLESYREMYNIKKRLIDEEKIINSYSSYNIDREIINIVEKMFDNVNNFADTLNYDLIDIKDKIYAKNAPLLHKVKMDVSSHFLLIKKLFSDLDKSNDNVTFESIACQIKNFYINVKKITDDQELIYNQIAQWLKSKIGEGSIEAYKIIVSFFIQDCEVFSNVTK